MNHKLGAVLFASIVLSSCESKKPEIEGNWELECRDIDVSSVKDEHQKDFSSFINGDVRIQLWIEKDSMEILIEGLTEPQFKRQKKWEYKLVEHAGNTFKLNMTSGDEVAEEVLEITGDGGLNPVGKDGIRMLLNEYGCLYYK